MPIGFSFQPGSFDARTGGQAQPAQPGGAAVAPSPSSVEIKSLKIPQRNVPGQIAPQALLQSPGAAGAGVGLSQLLPLLIQAFAPQGTQPGAPTSGMMPAPGGGYQAPAENPLSGRIQPGGGFHLPGERVAPQPPTPNDLMGAIGDALGAPTPSAPPQMPAAPPPTPTLSPRIIPGQTPPDESAPPAPPPVDEGVLFDQRPQMPSLFDNSNSGDNMLWSTYGRKAGRFEPLF